MLIVGHCCLSARAPVMSSLLKFGSFDPPEEDDPSEEQDSYESKSADPKPAKRRAKTKPPPKKSQKVGRRRRGSSRATASSRRGNGRHMKYLLGELRQNLSAKLSWLGPVTCSNGNL